MDMGIAWIILISIVLTFAITIYVGKRRYRKEQARSKKEPPNEQNKRGDH